MRHLCPLLALGLGACATYQPGTLDPETYLARAQTETEDGVTVTTAALSAAESGALFGVDLADDDIQPVWIEIENREDAAYWYMHRYTDPMYFSAAEVAFANRGFAGAANQRMEEVFHQRSLEGYVPPLSTVAGFVYTRDAAFQKARDDIHRRNHLRLWLAPLRHDGQDVWIGQISRDIGVRFTTSTWNLTTHAIDPDVDAERWYLAQDLASVNALSKYGLVGGVGVSTLRQPRVNAGGDPYFTDGLRAVLFIASEPLPITAIEWLDWREEPMPTERDALLSQ